jgi:hypothetical protein
MGTPFATRTRSCFARLSPDTALCLETTNSALQLPRQFFQALDVLRVGIDGGVILFGHLRDFFHIARDFIAGHALFANRDKSRPNGTSGRCGISGFGQVRF